jgi:hypothetical protein
MVTTHLIVEDTPAGAQTTKHFSSLLTVDNSKANQLKDCKSEEMLHVRRAGAGGNHQRSAQCSGVRNDGGVLVGLSIPISIHRTMFSLASRVARPITAHVVPIMYSHQEHGHRQGRPYRDRRLE